MSSGRIIDILLYRILNHHRASLLPLLCSVIKDPLRNAPQSLAIHILTDDTFGPARVRISTLSAEGLDSH